jgi:hypothetical protein
LGKELIIIGGGHVPIGRIVTYEKFIMEFNGPEIVVGVNTRQNEVNYPFTNTLPIKYISAPRIETPFIEPSLKRKNRAKGNNRKNHKRKKSRNKGF